MVGPKANRTVGNVGPAGLEVLGGLPKRHEYSWDDIETITKLRVGDHGPCVYQLRLAGGPITNRDGAVILSETDGSKLLANAKGSRALESVDMTGEMTIEHLVPDRKARWVFEVVEQWLTSENAKITRREAPRLLEGRHGTYWASPMKSGYRKLFRMEVEEDPKGAILKVTLGCIGSDLRSMEQLGWIHRQKEAWNVWLSGLWARLGTGPPQAAPPITPNKAREMASLGRGMIIVGGVIALVMLLVLVATRPFVPPNLLGLFGTCGFGVVGLGLTSVIYGFIRFRAGKRALEVMGEPLSLQQTSPSVAEEMRPHFDRFQEVVSGLAPGSHPDKEAAADALGAGWELAEVYSGDMAGMEDGLRDFRTALEHDATLAEAYAGIGECFMASGYWQSDQYLPDAMQDGLQWVERGLAIDPENHRCLYSKAKLLWASGKTSESAALADHIVKKHPSQPGGYHALMLCRVRLRRWEEAVKLGRTAVAKTLPGSKLRLFHHRKLASAINDSGDRNEAAKEYERLLTAFPEDAFSLHNASILYYDRKDFEKALTLSDRALAVSEFDVARQINLKIRNRLGKR